jgi:hypothetical protein
VKCLLEWAFPCLKCPGVCRGHILLDIKSSRYMKNKFCWFFTARTNTTQQSKGRKHIQSFMRKIWHIMWNRIFFEDLSNSFIGAVGWGPCIHLGLEPLARSSLDLVGRNIVDIFNHTIKSTEV